MLFSIFYCTAGKLIRCRNLRGAFTLCLDCDGSEVVDFIFVAGALQQAHFIRMSDPRSDTTLLLGNVYQWQASQPAMQVAMLQLISQVITRCQWSDHADLVIIGGDFNASCRPRVGYAETEATRSADTRLEDWSRQAGLTCAAPYMPRGRASTSRVMRF